jgi:uncharacterized membrane protein YphA (DoxX/SURF4 family)
MGKFDNKIVSALFRIVLGLVFIYAAVGKIAEPETFAQAIENYQLIGADFSHYVALVLPWLEMYSGIFLMVGFKVRSNAVIVSGMTFVFIIALIYALYMNLDIDCGCFDRSGLSQKVTWLKIIEDLVLLSMGLYVIEFPHGWKGWINKKYKTKI